MGMKLIWDLGISAQRSIKHKARTKMEMMDLILTGHYKRLKDIAISISMKRYKTCFAAEMTQIAATSLYLENRN